MGYGTKRREAQSSESSASQGFFSGLGTAEAREQSKTARGANKAETLDLAEEGKDVGKNEVASVGSSDQPSLSGRDRMRE